MSVLAFDTSNYTTSVAWFDGIHGFNQSQLLPVQPGALGLRQSEALFFHVTRLPELAQQLFAKIDSKDPITAIGVSTRPRAVEGSYMPCFLAGISQARTMAAMLKVPVVEVSHQQGHLAAALWSSGHLDWAEKPFLAWHLSGGTTELLHVEPENGNFKCTPIGGTTDISAGQLIDRTGQLLGCAFPAGKEIDALSKTAQDTAVFRVKCPGLEFSLSGVQNKVQAYHAQSQDPAETAAYALRCVCKAVTMATEHAMKAYPGLPVLFSGGVASNSMLRETMEPYGAAFCEPRFSTDNAMGVAVLTHKHMEA